MKDFYAWALLLCDYWIFRFCTLFSLVKEHEVEGNMAVQPSISSCSSSFGIGIIRWANSEQCSVPETLLPFRASLPLGKRFQKTGTGHWFQRCLLTEESDWFRSRALNADLFYFNWGSCWRYLLDALKSPILYRKSLVGSKARTKGKLIQKIWVMFFKRRFWVKHTCLHHSHALDENEESFFLRRWYYLCLFLSSLVPLILLTIVLYYDARFYLPLQKSSFKPSRSSIE